MGRKSRFDELRMYLRPVRYWRPTRQVELVRDVGIGLYPVNVHDRIDEDFFELRSEAGIPIRDFGGRIGRQHTPVLVAAYALGLFDKYQLTGQPEYRSLFLKQCEWLLEHREDRPVGCVWSYPFDWLHGLRKGWISAMAQGEAMSVLARGFLLTRDERFLQTAMAAVRPLTVGIVDGGLLAYMDDKLPFFQESPALPSSHILNGFLYTLFGLRDLARVAGHQTSQSLYAQGIDTLSQVLERFDTGSWSLYDLYDPKSRNVASLTYHELHIAQLYGIRTDLPVAESVAMRWQRYLDSGYLRLMALYRKTWQKLLRY